MKQGRIVFAALALLTSLELQAQNITNAEYFFDADPGFGNGTAISLTPAQNISGLVFNASVATLHPGMHTMYVRSKDANGRWSVSNSMTVAKVQGNYANPYASGSINKAEYFYDTDPGAGNGTNIPLTAGSDISGLVFNAATGALNGGMHTLYVRTRDASGAWSVTNSMVFTKVQSLYTNPYTAGNINKAEYFFDTDPGFGSGTDIPLTPSGDISGMVVNTNVASLHGGVHTLYIRTRDNAGKWSIAQTANFVKVQGLYGNPYSAGNVVKMEYFFNSDPGWGNGVDIPVTAATDIGNMVVNLSLTSLTTGLHTFYIRSKDAQGRWSVTHSMVFSKIIGPIPNPYSVSNINKAEYFFDTDPGLGNGTDIPVTPATDISGLVFAANVAPLTGGVHTLYVRTRDANGQWSITNASQFVKYQHPFGNLYTAGDISKAEYFFDADPGFGNGTDIPVTPAGDIQGLVVNLPLSGLSSGIHSLYIRTRDGSGRWSMTNTANFVKIQQLYPNPYTAGNIEKLEYYFDTDPGAGNGIDVPVTPSGDISNLVFNADVSGLHAGVHSLYLRSRDAQGRWSLVNRTDFARVQPLYVNPYSGANITYLEYFIDTDPGLGNGSQVPFTAATDVANLAFNVDMTTILNGNHELYVRSRDALGNWSITNIHNFVGGTGTLSMQLISFEAKLQADRKVLLEWVTEQERNVAHYRLQRSYDAASWTELTRTEPEGNNGTGRNSYQYRDTDPGTGVIYYKLTEVDNSGKETQAPIRFVRIADAGDEGISLYPNPNSGTELKLSAASFGTEPVQVMIMGSDGKLYLRTSRTADGGTILIRDLNLASGNYFVNVSWGNRTESLKLQVISERP